MTPSLAFLPTSSESLRSLAPTFSRSDGFSTLPSNPPKLPAAKVDLLPRYEGTSIPPATATYALKPAVPAILRLSTSPSFARKLSHMGTGFSPRVGCMSAPVTAKTRSSLAFTENIPAVTSRAASPGAFPTKTLASLRL